MKEKINTQKVLILTMTATLFGFFSFGQESDNLVPNPSFESAQVGKIRKPGDIDKADGWLSPTGNRADIFASGSKTPEFGTPDNLRGSEEPQDGMNYAGIVAYSYREKENRTYITTMLNQPLVKGVRYKVQFYASLAELSKYSANRLGVHFSRKLPGTDQKVPGLVLDTHIEHPDKERFSGMYGWDLVCGEFTAKGGEKFITIGNFSKDDDIVSDRVRKPANFKGTQMIAAYYFIDNVSVEMLGTNEDCNCGYKDSYEEVSVTVYQRTPNISSKTTPTQELEARNIYYGSGRYDLGLDGKKTLDRIEEILKENPGLTLQITGHSDNEEASSIEDKVVSQRRSDYVKSLLVEKGISESRIITMDIKDSKPSQYISDSDTDDLKNAKNRRVSFRGI